MVLKTIVLKAPGGSVSYQTVETKPYEKPEQIATRMAPRVPLGTLLVIDGNEQWAVLEKYPARVERCYLSDGPRVGEYWRPKDRRRKSGFRIKAIRADVVEADDGRTIQLKRMSRYEKVG